MDQRARATAEIRRFHRFYLPYFHLLTHKYLNSDYSVTETRILYEIFHQPGISAAEIAGRLHIDKGYLSRVLKRLEAGALLHRRADAADARRGLLTLTESGTAATQALIDESNLQIERDLAGLSDGELERLTGHIGEIIDILGGNRNEGRTV